jgi:hypothetical protein
VSGRKDRPEPPKETKMHPEIIRQIADQHARELRAAAKAARRARKARAR